MAKLQKLQDDFSGGMIRERSRGDLPPNAAWRISDFFPNMDGVLQKRGGWSYHGSALTTLNASAGLPEKVAYAPFSAGGQVVAIDASLGRLFDLTNSADRGAAQLPVGPMTFYRNLLLIPSTSAGVVPMKYSGSGAPAALGGSPPTSGFLCVYKDRLVGNEVGGVGTAVNRLHFSAAGNPESWSTSVRYIDTSAPVIAMAALRNSLLIFHQGSVERIRGDIPPGSAAANMTLEPLFNDVGLLDPDALWVEGDSVYWADESGIYMSDGSSLTNLTLNSISSLWRTHSPPALYISLVVYKGRLIVSLGNDAVNLRRGFMYDFRTRAWVEIENLLAKNFATRSDATDACYFSNQDTSSKRVGEVSTMFSPVASNKEDANGGDIDAVLETAFYSFGSEALKRWRGVYVSYSAYDSVESPSMSVAYLTDPALGSSETAISSALSESATRTRARRAIGVKSYGLAFDVELAGPASTAKIYALEADVHEMEDSRL